MRSSVDLPAPERPMMPTIWPFGDFQIDILDGGLGAEASCHFGNLEHMRTPVLSPAMPMAAR